MNDDAVIAVAQETRDALEGFVVCPWCGTRFRHLVAEFGGFVPVLDKRMHDLDDCDLRVLLDLILDGVDDTGGTA